MDASPAPRDGPVLLHRQSLAALRALLRPTTYVGAGVEVLHGFLHAAMYPFGMFSVEAVQQALGIERAVRPVQRQAAAATARMPVILVHGYVMNRSAFFLMTQALRQAGFDQVRAFNYPQFTHGLDRVAGMLAREVDRALAVSDAPQCMIVGHSMGGIVARYFVQALGGEDSVDTVITLGTPHRGTYTAQLAMGPTAAQMSYRSPFLEQLRRSARPSPVRYISYYSDLDAFVLPGASAKLLHPALQATNVRVRDIGHLSMLLSGQVIHSVVEYLAHPERDRPRPVSGVTALPTPEQRRRRGAAGDEPPGRTEPEVGFPPCG